MCGAWVSGLGCCKVSRGRKRAQVFPNQCKPVKWTGAAIPSTHFQATVSPPARRFSPSPSASLPLLQSPKSRNSGPHWQSPLAIPTSSPNHRPGPHTMPPKRKRDVKHEPDADAIGAETSTRKETKKPTVRNPLLLRCDIRKFCIDLERRLGRYISARVCGPSSIFSVTRLPRSIVQYPRYAPPTSLLLIITLLPLDADRRPGRQPMKPFSSKQSMIWS